MKFIKMKYLYSIIIVLVGLVTISVKVTSKRVVSFQLALVDSHLDVGKETAGNICPNKRTKCTDSQTCCQTKHNSYHCCKYANAVCCPDKFHCCPNGTTCDRVHKRCIRHIETKNPPIQTTPEPMEMPVIDETDVKIITEQTCPNNRTKCQDSQTCCVTKHGSYHCCKFANAVCCPDKFHCCPQGSTCDSKLHKCVKCAKSNIEMKRLIPALNVEDIPKVQTSEVRIDEKDEVMCANNKTKCKDTKTCCITKHNNYYCCPHKNAVCCSDKYQCCPQATTCDIKNKKCISSSKIIRDSVQFQTNFLKMSSPLLRSKQTRSKPDLYCQMANGQFGLCKFSTGVCCSDLTTCCPQNTTCDDKINKCTVNSIDFSSEKFKASKITSRLSTVVCPDNETECFSWETCCAISDSSYGCCEYENAVCCADRVSCCKYNQTCDIKTNSCVNPHDNKKRQFLLPLQGRSEFWKILNIRNRNHLTIL